MKKVIFDTDVGIDDAMALLFLHYSPDVELRAIVSGFGNASVENTTRNALHIKERFGISAPVFQGAAGPMGLRVGEGYPDFVHGKNGLGDIEFPEPGIEVESTPGAEAIANLAREYPGELSLVAVGRMTNVAAALQICPELPTLLREVVVMGGAFGFNGHYGNVSPVAEANIAGDPQAADRVFTSGLRTTIVGLDVTKEANASADFFASLKATAGKAGAFINDIGRFYLDFHENSTGTRSCPVHDSSAVAYLLVPELFSARAVSVRVVTNGIAMGQTTHRELDETYAVPDWDNLPVVSICTGVNADALLKLYLDTLGFAGNQR